MWRENELTEVQLYKVQEIENAMDDHDRKNSVSRREWALKYSWENRVSEYLNVIQRSINNKMG